MGISRFKFVLALALFTAVTEPCRAQEEVQAAPISAEEQAKIDAVIEAAKQEVNTPAASEAAPSEPAGSGKAEATISSSGKTISVTEEKKEPGKAVVTVKEEPKKVAEKKTAPKKAVVAKAFSPKKSFTPVVAKLPEPRLPNAAPVTPVLVAKPNPPVKTTAPVKATAAVKTTTAVKRVSVEVQKPLGSVNPLSGFELGRYQYCGDDRDCMVAVNGCCDCANGGEDVAVNRDRFSVFRGRFACMNVACGEKSVEPTCSSGVVSCVNHRCRYFTDTALEDKF